MSTTIVWETGLTCDGPDCRREFMLGEEVIFWYGKKLCSPCAAQDAASRREAAGEAEDVLAVTRRHLDAGGRVILTRRQLRKIRGIGPRRVSEIEAALVLAGLNLAGHPQRPADREGPAR